MDDTEGATNNQWHVSDSLRKRMIRSATEKKIDDEKRTGNQLLSPNGKLLKRNIELVDQDCHPADRHEIISLLHEEYAQTKLSPTCNSLIQRNSVTTNTTDSSVPAQQQRKTTLDLEETSWYDTNKLDGDWKRIELKEDHVMVGHCLDCYGGPLLKTNYAQRNNLKHFKACRPNWYVRIYGCHRPDCSFKMKVYASSPKMSCVSFQVWKGDDHSHPFVTWYDYYKYEVKVRKSQCSMDPISYDPKLFPKRVGIPNSMQAEIEIAIRGNPTIGGRAFMVQYEKSNNHTVLMGDVDIRQAIAVQVSKKIKNVKMDLQTLPIMTHVCHILKFQDDYRLDTTKIRKERVPKLVVGDQALRDYAYTLQTQNLLHGKSIFPNRNDLCHRELVVLDHPAIESNAYYQEILKSSSHVTGNNPRATSICFTTIALLSNICSCSLLDWEISASLDGTFNVANNGYILSCLGVINCNEKGTRQFYPVAYCFGPGERTIITTILILNVKLAVYNLFGIGMETFVGGVCSDRSHQFAQPVLNLFSNTTSLTCYIHIIRKFFLDGQKGNGGYAKLLTTNNHQWFTDVAKNDVQLLNQCGTKYMFLAFAFHVCQAWCQAGESKLWETFSQSYVFENPYNNWFYSASGLVGCCPDNQPIESHNHSSIKSKCGGDIILGRTFEAALSVEMTKLCYNTSTWLIGTERIYPVLDYNKCVNNENFLEYYAMYDKTIDIVPFQNGFLMNDVMKINQPITNKRIHDMQKAATGCYQCNTNDRKNMIDAFRDLHVLNKIVRKSSKTDDYVWICNCRQYYKRRWCYPALLLQHNLKLDTTGKKIIGKISMSTRMTEKQREKQTITMAKMALKKFKAETI